MIKLSCRETGLDCDFITEGETEEKVLAVAAEHSIRVHGLKAKDIFVKKIPCDFLCHVLGKINNDRNV